MDLLEPKNCACFNLRKASRAVTQVYDRLLQRTGLRVTQFTILVSISRTGSVTISNLAKQLVMDRTTLTRNLRPLEREGFLKISPGKDLRTRYVTLLKKGKDVLTEAIPLWERAQRNFEAGLGKQRFHSLVSNLSETVEITQNHHTANP
ncbi:winged helix-turn-helix transcriptional regulator [candidate division KSB1 bacterium]|nr:winged helix-turn-helix transcriptional regulator [candidate division KSB1 bacterium]NIR70622.1 winged helix-turn-helix transcriptional regulator [candidate division KSB1 bacterium]NIS23427.1 winged helix-turn-helix transcriptional regulator [candidate division KSB1 bacterium]NIT74562.1 winged helix-turn-helix transcriptional regulator [candidate division KSB1 bacterium]NIU28389.1 winged helix-turn-helix transcriptional regulator [candidate division KSB1 bacterium]